MKPPRGIEYNGVKTVFDRVGDGFFCGLDRILRAFFKHLAADLFADYLQLLYCGGAVDIAPDEQRVLALLFEPVAQLCAVRGLTGALQTAHEYYCRRAGRRL